MVSEIYNIKSVAPDKISMINTISKSAINTINGVAMPTTGSGSWHDTTTQWTDSQGWWSTDHWQSNGWELLLLEDGASASSTKIRITFTGASPLNFSLRNATGSVSYVADAAYESLTELDFEITDTWGRLYMEGGSFSVYVIELFY